MKVRFWGVRGSLPTPGQSTIRVGGNTSCVEVIADGNTILFDAGSGLAVLGGRMMRDAKPVKASLFMSHVHHDHVQGFPFFVPAYTPTTSLNIYAERKGKAGPERIFNDVMMAPFFPVTISMVMKANINFNEVADGDKVRISPSVSVFARKLNHPNGALGYRVESVEKGKKRVFAYVTDTEHTNEPDQNIIDLIREADAFAYDSMYTADEYKAHKGFGHSTWEEAVRLAKLAKAKRYVIFHHDPSHSDRDMAKILKEAREQFKRTLLAFEGLELSF